MENKYEYFERDISWLSFNYRVLLEAKDNRIPLFERINFISIYSSNLEEFYKVRVAEHKATASGITQKKAGSVKSAQQLVEGINTEVNRQLDDRVYIYERKIIPALKRNHIIFYQNSNINKFHKEFATRFFKEEIFPYLQPVLISKGNIISFLRDNRLYLTVRLYQKGDATKTPYYFLIKLPHNKVPRFIELPKHDKFYYIMFIEDIIKANIKEIFPGYIMESCYCIKISRDADIVIDDVTKKESLVKQLKEKVKKRKIGAVCRFVYERAMPNDFLNFLAEAYNIDKNEMIPGDKHLNMEDLQLLPNPNNKIKAIVKPEPMKLNILNEEESIFKYIEQKDLLVHYPYHTFDHFIHFLYEAVHDPYTEKIMITQYRVAENSAVINTLISAAQNGKKVTVFVELKARFDEENNLETAKMMENYGIKIIYSLPKLKVHAKVALIYRRGLDKEKVNSFAYISTGNFNEKTAKLYADTGLFTANKTITNDLHNLFKVLKHKKEKTFKSLLVTQFNLIDELYALIDHEIKLVEEGKKGRIIIKLNALQDKKVIDKLYEASIKGVKIDLIIRGICCLIPNKSYSKNIKITRIVDTFLEHARIWYFGNDNNPKLFLGSPDFMERNLYRRIEAVTPIFDNDLKSELIDMLNIQLRDNQKACFVDENLNNIFKHKRSKDREIRAQYSFYDYLKRKNDIV